MRYRRNSDSHLRNLERRWLSTGSLEDKISYCGALLRAGHKPYWFVLREKQPRRDSVYYDGELESNERRYREAIAIDPDQTYVQEPDLYIESYRHPEGIPRWEERGLSGDKIWQIDVRFPQANGSMINIWLGEVHAYSGPSGLRISITTFADLFSFDEWYERSQDRPNEAARSQWSLSSLLTKGSSQAFQFRTIINAESGENWDPTQPLPHQHARALNLPATDPEAERPYRDHGNLIREGQRPVYLPDEDFLVPDLLFELFLQWLEQTPCPYGHALQEVLLPPGPQLPEGRWINVYIWKEYDGEREIAGVDDPNAAQHQQHRYVYDVGYKLIGDDFFGARFHRWDHDDGYIANIITSAKPINATTISYLKPSQQAHQEARKKARIYAQRKLDKFLEIAEKWGYRVNVIEGEPPRPRPRPHTWSAGMQYPLPDYLENKEPNYFR